MSSTKLRVAFGFMASIAAACASDSLDGSGVPGGKRIVDLSDAEDRSVCTYIVNVAGPERTIACPDGSKVTIGNDVDVRQTKIDDCVRHNNQSADDYPMCELLVSDYEGCEEALAALTDEQLCDEHRPSPAACQYVFNPTPNCGGPVARE